MKKKKKKIFGIYECECWAMGSWKQKKESPFVICYGTYRSSSLNACTYFCGHFRSYLVDEEAPEPHKIKLKNIVLFTLSDACTGKRQQLQREEK